MKRTLPFLFALLAPPSLAIVGRDDRPDERYRIDDAEFPALVDVMGQVGGTLIAPQWVLTAAHTVEAVDPFSDWRVYVGGRRYDIARIILHPKRVFGTVDPDYDLALLKLASPVEGVAPAPLYRWLDEVDQTAVLVGRGAHGTGQHDQRPHEVDRQLRRAFNVVEAVFEHSLVFVFDTPPRGLELEGVSGRGDSGGPAFLERDGVMHLAGVSSINSREGLESSRYGTLTGYVRVSGHVEWIDETLAADPPSTLTDWPPLVTGVGRFPSTPAGALAEGFLAALDSGREARLVAWFRKHGATGSSSPEEAAAEWLVARKESGNQALYGYTALDHQNIAFVTRGKAGGWHAYLIATQPEDPGRIGSLMSGGLPGPPHHPDDDAG